MGDSRVNIEMSNMNTDDNDYVLEKVTEYFFFDFWAWIEPSLFFLVAVAIMLSLCSLCSRVR